MIDGQIRRDPNSKYSHGFLQVYEERINSQGHWTNTVIEDGSKTFWEVDIVHNEKCSHLSVQKRVGMNRANDSLEPISVALTFVTWWIMKMKST